jgi:hypothetical protein
MRLVYLLIKYWSNERLEYYLESMAPLLINFVLNCENIVDMRVIHYIFDRISDSQKILSDLAHSFSPNIMSALRDFL